MIKYTTSLSSRLLKFLYLFCVAVPMIILLIIFLQNFMSGQFTVVTDYMFGQNSKYTVRFIINLFMHIVICLFAFFVLNKPWDAKDKFIRNSLIACVLVFIIQLPIVYGVLTLAELIDLIPNVNFYVNTSNWLLLLVWGVAQPQCLITAFTAVLLFFVYRNGICKATATPINPAAS